MFHYKECGLSTVWLINGFAAQIMNHEGPVQIKDLCGLHRLIAQTLLNCRNSLAGREMCFLRREMRLLQQELAAKLGINPALISRWENRLHPLPRYADLALRALYANTLLEKSGRELHLHLVSESAHHLLKEQLVFIFRDRHWQRYVPA